MGASISKLQLGDFCYGSSDSYREYITRVRGNKSVGRGVYGDCNGPHGTVRHGMGCIVEGLCKVGDGNFKDRIRLGVQVVGVDYAGGGGKVVLKTQKGDTYRCKILIITVPLGCLKRDTIRFDPPLPLWKRNAIKNVGMGCYKKVFLTFDSIFWDPEPPILALARITHPKKTKMERREGDLDLGDKLTIENLWAKDQVPCLAAILVGDAAENARGRPDEEIVSAVLHLMRMCMQPSVAVSDCVASEVTRWEVRSRAFRRALRAVPFLS